MREDDGLRQKAALVSKALLHTTHADISAASQAEIRGGSRPGLPDKAGDRHHRRGAGILPTSVIARGADRTYGKLVSKSANQVFFGALSWERVSRPRDEVPAYL